MKWLNYHHLYYFWAVAREGSISRASEELLVSQPTVSSQIAKLEKAVGKPLFDRVGRGVVLTETGRLVLSYANEIFTLGREMMDVVERQPAGRPVKLTVGLLDMIPKTVARLLLEPALRLPQPVRLICREDKADRLLADLAAHRTDVVLSDAPIGTAVQVQGHNHLLGECGVSFFGTPALAGRYARNFPRSLDGAPLLLPSDHTAMRRSLNLWFEARRIHPLVVGEFDDGAMLNAVGQSGAGLFPAASVVEQEVRRQHGVKVIGRTTEVRERFYAITVEAKLKHPAVVAICEAARQAVFQEKSR
jgi:LysR family transcriptional activator of nhaA